MGSVRLTARRRAVVVAALMLAAFTFNTTENLPVGLLSLISDDLRVSPASVGLLVTGYGLTVAVVSLPVAHITRSVPRRHVLSGLLGLLVLASWVSALGAMSYGSLLAARIATALAQALFWAVMGPVAVGLFPSERRGRIIGLLSVGVPSPPCSGCRPEPGWAGTAAGGRLFWRWAGSVSYRSWRSPCCCRPHVRRRGLPRTGPLPTPADSPWCWPPPRCR